MRRVKIERKVALRGTERDRRYVVLPLDARDPAIVRAKHLLRIHHGSRTSTGS
jgi:hypothetical protein